MLDFLWIGIAFLAGISAHFIKLPPLIGYLVAGFILHALGAESHETIDLFAEVGVLLLLFTIGLKLNIKSLFRHEVLGVALIHSSIGLALFAACFYFLPIRMSFEASLILAFALTFSSTVYVFKTLESRGDFSSHYGRVAIGILVIQDILAVLFLAIAADKTPSTWFLLLVFLLMPIRFALLKILTRVPRGELLVLFGLAAALGGAFVFDLVNVKGDIGALVMGVLLAGHSRTNELSKTLISLKDLFLLGFFLSIGLHGMPGWENILIALAICIALPFRSLLYYFLFYRCGLRARSSFLSATTLFNYSEFGLIVLTIAVEMAWVDPSWLTTMALILSFSFILSAFINHKAQDLCSRYLPHLQFLQKDELHPEERPIELGDANVLVLGMGRVGRSTYQSLEENPEWKPMGIELDPEIIGELQKQGLRLIKGSATNPDFWHRIQLEGSKIRLIVLALPLFEQNMIAVKYARERGYTARLVSIAKFPNEIDELRKAGVDRAFNLYAEAGLGLARSALDLCEDVKSA